MTFRQGGWPFPFIPLSSGYSGWAGGVCSIDAFSRQPVRRSPCACVFGDQHANRESSLASDTKKNEKQGPRLLLCLVSWGATEEAQGSRMCPQVLKLFSCVVLTLQLNLSRPIEEQGPLDVIIHKLTDVILEADQNDSQSLELVHRFQVSKGGDARLWGLWGLRGLWGLWRGGKAGTGELSALELW